MEERVNLTAQVGRDGRITIPKLVRDQLGLQPGDEVTFTDGAGGCYIRKEMPPRSLEEFQAALDYYAGYLKDDLDGLTVDEYIEEMRGPPLEPELRSEPTT